MKKFTTETRRAWRRDAIYRVFPENASFRRKGFTQWRFSSAKDAKGYAFSLLPLRLHCALCGLVSAPFSAVSSAVETSRRDAINRVSTGGPPG
ncbi:MAG: hypothetical protein AVDCRST_MAG56-7847 [uncultured Cytophagales bacterium]|uniref:Uncharacterized protein n=1 Tax=uncultured Cytophagales bacterium TaxID=158755 RepID=A0A6J4LQS9_9SPHI|nr:MAG: hypothetical protein AVDCRST_MAG56-7847 [uncultured Cytophagales bacterium]